MRGKVKVLVSGVRGPSPIGQQIDTLWKTEQQLMGGSATCLLQNPLQLSADHANTFEVGAFVTMDTSLSSP